VNEDLRQKPSNRLLRLLYLVEDSFLVLLLSSMIILAVSQIVMRNFFSGGVSWADPLLRLLVLWVGLAGAMVATRQDHHISIDVFTRIMPPRLQLATRILSDCFSALVSAILAYHAARLVQMDRDSETLAFAQIPSWWCELIIPLAFTVIALRYLVFTGLHGKQFFTQPDQ